MLEFVTLRSEFCDTYFCVCDTHFRDLGTYAEMVANISRDSRSAVKAWHFIKLMGTRYITKR